MAAAAVNATRLLLPPLLLLLATAVRAAPTPKAVDCDVVVAGGSTASLAAAIATATAYGSLSVCLTDPTDWLGGQMTASAVSAIDFGHRAPDDMSKSFTDLLHALGSPTNPGECWVSSMCYQPTTLLREYIEPTLAALPNLRVFNNTVITSTVPCAAEREGGATGANPKPGHGGARSGAGGTICALKAVQRSTRDTRAGAGWSQLLSESIQDWYAPAPSAAFEKTVLVLSGKVFIDATEFGDVLVTGAATKLRLPVVQGVEETAEASSRMDDKCGA